MSFFYTRTDAEADPHQLPDAEVFTIGPGDEDDLIPGWYWWPCLPGCLPEIDTPYGPFLTEQDAIEHARDMAADVDAL